MSDIIINDLGLQNYQTTLQAMQDFTANRIPGSHDEIWLVEHELVFTQGQAGKAEHILNVTDIPIVQSDRGGQVTYHGPGQLIAYVLIDLRKRNIGIRQLVCHLEQAVIKTLAQYDIAANGRRDMPGVYVDDKKIASVGLRIKRGYSYHGISFNVDMDLTPFSYINPCGYEHLHMTQLKDFLPTVDKTEVKERLTRQLVNQLA